MSAPMLTVVNDGGRQNAIDTAVRVRKWLEPMGWRAHITDRLYPGIHKEAVFHPDFLWADIEVSSDGEVELRRPGGQSGDYLLFEHVLSLYSDGSCDTVADTPFPLAVKYDVVIDFIDANYPDPADCGMQTLEELDRITEAAICGEISFWHDNVHRIPDENKIDERDLAALDRVKHSPRAAELLVAVLASLPAPKNAPTAPTDERIVPKKSQTAQKTKPEASTSEPVAPPAKLDTAELVRLAKLPLLEYDRQREEAAKRLGCRVGTLDTEVALLRGDSTDSRLAGDAVLFPKREPWPSQVNGAELLDELERTFKRFVFMPPHASIACALWTVFTHLIDAAEVAPILAAQSAEKRSGKTTLLDLLGRLVRRPLATSNLSAAALFRSVEKWTPTLMIDEADSFLRASDELRNLMNAGHTRTLAYVLRCVGDDSEPRRFSTWGAKAIALIGRLPDTLQDRSIVIPLRRRLPHESIERLRYAPTKLFGDLARQAERFTQDNTATFKRARPQIPEALHDRAADCWEPLLALADLVGGDWPKQTRDAAIALSGGSQDAESVRVELLNDVHNMFTRIGSERIGSERIGSEHISSAALCEALAADPEGRWCEFSHGKPITPRQLARLLRPFSIVPNTVRTGGLTAKGYSREDFDDAFKRYLPHSIRNTVTSA